MSIQNSSYIFDDNKYKEAEEFAKTVKQSDFDMARDARDAAIQHNSNQSAIAKAMNQFEVDKVPEAESQISK